MSGAGDSGVVRAELLGDSVNAATVVVCAAIEACMTRVATLFAACSGLVGVVTVCGAGSAWMRATVSDIRDTDTQDDSDMHVWRYSASAPPQGICMVASASAVSLVCAWSVEWRGAAAVVMGACAGAVIMRKWKRVKTVVADIGSATGVDVIVTAAASHVVVAPSYTLIVSDDYTGCSEVRGACLGRAARIRAGRRQGGRRGRVGQCQLCAGDVGGLGRAAVVLGLCRCDSAAARSHCGSRHQCMDRYRTPLPHGCRIGCRIGCARVRTRVPRQHHVCVGGAADAAYVPIRAVAVVLPVAAVMPVIATLSAVGHIRRSAHAGCSVVAHPPTHVHRRPHADHVLGYGCAATGAAACTHERAQVSICVHQ